MQEGKKKLDAKWGLQNSEVFCTAEGSLIASQKRRPGGIPSEELLQETTDEIARHHKYIF